MKAVNGTLSFFVIALLCVCVCLSNAWADEDLILKDKEQPMILFCDVETGRVEFQTRIKGFGDASGRKLSRMKRQVEKLFKSKMLEFGGYTIELVGYPIWGPYGSFGQGGGRMNLFFAEKFTVDHDSKTIIMVGSREKPSSYFPYNLPGY